MAKADDASSTRTDGCRRPGAGNRTLSGRRSWQNWLTEWMATGKVPWTCRESTGLDAKGLAEKRQRKLHAERLAEERREQGEAVGGVIYSLPSATYFPGDPRFWSARPLLWTDWEDNSAYQRRRHGAQALRNPGVAHAPSRAAAPKSHASDEATPEPAKPAEGEDGATGLACLGAQGISATAE